jgi:uroporphyrinogen-III decarboxylase
MIQESKSGPIPEPGKFILDDIRKWRDIIKRPAILDEIDWPSQAKKDLDNRDPELPRTGWVGMGNGYFMNLTYFMGFTNALIACLEEPEEVKDLMNFLLDLNLELGKNLIEHYKYDLVTLGDDIAHEHGPFVSEAVFMDLFEPMWRQNVAIFREADIYAEHHNCGKIEPFIKHIVNMGFNSWGPAQRSNDLAAIKREYDSKFIISGGFENNGFVSWPETTQEEVRAEVRHVMDELAPGGGFAFGGFIMGGPEYSDVNLRNEWIRDEYEKNKFKYYS